jgi:hypothetical protein
MSVRDRVKGSPVQASRWFGVGAAEAHGRGAGARAADEALVGDDPKLLVVFCSPSNDLQALLREISDRAGEIPLIGCTTAGEIGRSGPSDGSVVVAALGGPGFSVETASATEASQDLRKAGSHAARCVPEETGHPYRVLLLLSDGLAGDQREVVRGAYEVLGAAVPLVGGCAGDDLKMARTFQFHGGEVLTDAVVAAGIASDAPLGIGVRHGWRRVGEPMLVTASSGNRVHALDDRPALDAYLEHLGLDEPAHGDQEALTRMALTHPLGLVTPRGEEVIRFIGGGDFVERSLACIAEVPQGVLVWIMEGDAQSVLEATEAAAAASLAALDGRPPLGMLAFDCIARRSVLGDEGIQTEIDRLATLAAGVPIAGFYTYGEIARMRGARGFHNQTLVVLALA